jgi:hypothetical protein
MLSYHFLSDIRTVLQQQYIECTSNNQDELRLESEETFEEAIWEDEVGEEGESFDFSYY